MSLLSTSIFFFLRKENLYFYAKIFECLLCVLLHLAKACIYKKHRKLRQHSCYCHPLTHQEITNAFQRDKQYSTWMMDLGSVASSAMPLPLPHHIICIPMRQLQNEMDVNAPAQTTKSQTSLSVSKNRRRLLKHSVGD